MTGRSNCHNISCGHTIVYKPNTVLCIYNSTKMESKLIIFFVLITLVRSSLGSQTPTDNGLLGEISSDGSTIDGYYKVGILNSNKVVSTISTMIEKYAADIFVGGNGSIDPLVVDISKNSTFSGFISTFEVTLQALAVAHPQALPAIENVRPKLNSKVQSMVRAIYIAMDAARSRNNTDAIMTIEASEDEVLSGIPSLEEDMFYVFRYGLPSEPELMAPYAAVEKQSVSDLALAIRHIFTLMKILLASASAGEKVNREAFSFTYESVRDAAYSAFEIRLSDAFVFIKSIHASWSILKAGITVRSSQNTDIQEETLHAFSEIIDGVWKNIEEYLEDPDDVKINGFPANICTAETHNVTFKDVQNAITTDCTATVLLS